MFSASLFFSLPVFTSLSLPASGLFLSLCSQEIHLDKIDPTLSQMSVLSTRLFPTRELCLDDMGSELTESLNFARHPSEPSSSAGPLRDPTISDQPTSNVILDLPVLKVCGYCSMVSEHWRRKPQHHPSPHCCSSPGSLLYWHWLENWESAGASSFSTGKSKITFIPCLLRDKALDWAMAVWEHQHDLSGFCRGTNGRLPSIDPLGTLNMPFGLTNTPGVFQLNDVPSSPWTTSWSPPAIPSNTTYMFIRSCSTC